MSTNTNGKSDYVRLRRILVPTLISGALAYGSYRVSNYVVSRRAVHAASVNVAPFTLTMNLYDFTHVLAGAFEGQEVVARRSDGATVKQTPFLKRAGGELSGLTSRQLDFPDGRGFWIVDDIAAKATWPPLAGDRLSALLNSLTQTPTDCITPKSAEKLLKQSYISGESADIIAWPAIAGKTIIQWRVPALGCESIQYEIQEAQADGSVKVVFEGKLASLQLGAPSPTLFNEGDGCTEMRPSQIIKTALAKIGEPSSPMTERDGKRLDASYLQGRSQ